MRAADPGLRIFTLGECFKKDFLSERTFTTKAGFLNQLRKFLREPVYWKDFYIRAACPSSHSSHATPAIRSGPSSEPPVYGETEYIVVGIEQLSRIKNEHLPIFRVQ